MHQVGYENRALLQLTGSQTSHFVQLTKFASLSLREKTHVKILIQPVSVRGKAAELDKSMV